MPQTKLELIMEKFGETDASLAKKLGIVATTVHKHKRIGIKTKLMAYAYAYALECDYRDLLESRIAREGWELTPCLPGLE